MLVIWAKYLLPRALKRCPKYKTCPIWSHCNPANWGEGSLLTLDAKNETVIKMSKLRLKFHDKSEMLTV